MAARRSSAVPGRVISSSASGESFKPSTAEIAAKAFTPRTVFFMARQRLR
jgi:hypothetical protein